MRTLTLTLVFQDGSVPTDGSAPLEPFAQSIAIQRYTDCRLDLVCLKSDGTPYDLSGGALLFSAKARDSQTTPDLSLEADIDDGPGGLAHFIVGSVNSGAMAVNPYNYVVMFDDPSGFLWPPVKQGTLAINPTDYTPGQDVSVPESQQPLAQGPPGSLAFRYTTTGAEGGDFSVTIPVDLRPTGAYAVGFSLASDTPYIPLVFPVPDRSSNAFRCIGTAAYPADVVLEFMIYPVIT